MKSHKINTMENIDNNIILVAKTEKKNEEESTMPSTLVVEGFGFTKKEAKLTKEGLRGYYRCRHFRGKGCPVSLQVTLLQDGVKSLNPGKEPHTCLNPPTIKISEIPDITQEIANWVADNALEQMDIPAAKITAICLQYFNKKYNEQPVSFFLPTKTSSLITALPSKGENA